MCARERESERPNKGRITYYEFFVCLRLPRKLVFFKNILFYFIYLIFSDDVYIEICVGVQWCRIYIVSLYHCPEKL